MSNGPARSGPAADEVAVLELAGLSPAEIEALLAGGPAVVPAPPGVSAAAHRMAERVARRLAEGFEQLLGAPTRVDPAYLDAVDPSEFVPTLPDPCCALLLSAGKHTPHPAEDPVAVALVLPVPLAQGLIQQALGAPAGHALPDRPPTEVEWGVWRSAIRVVAGRLPEALGCHLRILDYAGSPRQLADLAGPATVLAYEVQGAGLSGLVQLLVAARPATA
jgi:hypothetical protein